MLLRNPYSYRRYLNQGQSQQCSVAREASLIEVDKPNTFAHLFDTQETNSNMEEEWKWDFYLRQWYRTPSFLQKTPSQILLGATLISLNERFMWRRFKFKLWMFVQDTFSIRAIWLYDNRVISVGGPSPFGTLALGLPQARLPPQIMILFAKRWSRTI